jgi:hypothetical protein
LLIALLLTAAQAIEQTYPADVINRGEYVGYWSDGLAWKVYEYRTADGGFCTVYSAPVRTPMGSYQLALTFGSVDELALVTSAPLAAASEGAIDFDNGDGFDWHDVVAHKIDKPNEDQLTYWYGNTMSSGMVQKLTAEMKHNKTAVFTYAANRFPISLSGFTAGYADMRHCDNHRVGRALEDRGSDRLKPAGRENRVRDDSL